jgi:hypothetical protein
VIHPDAWSDRAEAWAEYQRQAAADYIPIEELGTREGYLAGFAKAAELYFRDGTEWCSSPGPVEVQPVTVRSAE